MLACPDLICYGLQEKLVFVGQWASLRPCSVDSFPSGSHILASLSLATIAMSFQTKQQPSFKGSFGSKEKWKKKNVAIGNLYMVTLFMYLVQSNEPNKEK